MRTPSIFSVKSLFRDLLDHKSITKIFAGKSLHQAKMCDRFFPDRVMVVALLISKADEAEREKANRKTAIKNSRAALRLLGNYTIKHGKTDRKI